MILESIIEGPRRGTSSYMQGKRGERKTLHGFPCLTHVSVGTFLAFEFLGLLAFLTVDVL